MPAGRPRKSKTDKDLEGDKSKGKVHKPTGARLKGEPPELADDITCPDWLGEYGTEEWNHVAPILKGMGVLTVMDLTALGVCCAAYNDLRVAAAIVNKLGDGITVMNGTQEIPHPAIVVRNKAYTNYRNMLSHFGLSPVSREKVLADAPKHDEDDPLEELLAAGRNRGNLEV